VFKELASDISDEAILRHADAEMQKLQAVTAAGEQPSRETLARLEAIMWVAIDRQIRSGTVQVH
jgi:hypothetical protein